METFEFGIFDFLRIDQLSLTPESDFRDLIIEEVNTQINVFMGISVDFELERTYEDMSIGVYNSIHPETKDILCGFVGRVDPEFLKERSLLL